jgi:MFS family permease
MSGTAQTDPVDATLSRNIRLNNLNGVAATLALNMVTPFTGIFAIKLGASNLQVAMLSSLPALMSLLAMIPGAYLVDRVPRKKAVTAWFILASRAFFLVFALTPLFPPGLRATFLVGAVALRSFPEAIAGVSWQSFVAGAIPPGVRTGAFAYRQAITGVAGTVSVLVAGWLLDVLAFPSGYQIMFAVGFLVAMAEVAFFLGMHEAEAPRTHGSQSARGIGLGGWLREFLGHRSYLRFTAGSVVFHFGWQMAWPLFLRYQVDVLGATNTWMSIFTVTNSLSSVVTYRLWARWSDRVGTRTLLPLAALGLSTVPIGFVLSKTPLALALFNLWVGIFGGGMTFLLFNALLEVAPNDRRTSYIAYYNTLISLSGTIAPVIGVGLMERFDLVRALLAAAGFRLLGALAFWATERKGPRPIHSPNSSNVST